MPNVPVYLDYCATTPVDPAVVEAMLPYYHTHFGNAASKTHQFGWYAEESVKIARKTIASGIGAEPEEVIFTSGATEGINLAIRGVAETYTKKGKHIICLPTEHKAVIDTCNYLEKRGFEIEWLPVMPDGIVNLPLLAQALRPDTVLAIAMLANNETGVIQPIREIATYVHEAGALFMSDATQAVGKIPVDVNELGIDIMPFSAHKFYGPKGVGALYLRRKKPRVALAPLFHGGGHERGLRPGTLNVPGIVGMAKALELCIANMEPESLVLESLRNQLEKSLLEFPNAHVNGSTNTRLPHITNISFPGINITALLKKLNNIAVSTGSACTSARIEPSHVLAAMGVSTEEAYASLRFSLGRFTTEEEIQFTIKTLYRELHKLKGSS